MTVCRRIFDHIMIIVKGAENIKCNGKYYFHHLDQYDSPVFMQDILQNEEEENSVNINDNDNGQNNNKNKIKNSIDVLLGDTGKSLHEPVPNFDDDNVNDLTSIDIENVNENGKENDIEMDENKNHPMIIRKAHYENETGESLWTISDKNEDYYIGLSIDTMPPNDNWEAVNMNKNGDSPSTYSQAPTLIFYNRNQKMNKHQKFDDTKSGKYIEDHEIPMNKAQLLETFAHPSQSYHAPNVAKLNHESISPSSTPPIPPSNDEINIMLTSHYRIPSWKKNQTPWDLIMKEDQEFNLEQLVSGGSGHNISTTPMTNDTFPAMIMDEINKQSQLNKDDQVIEKELTINKLQQFGLKWKEEVYEWKTKYKQLQRKYNKMELSAKEYEKNACILYENLQDSNQTFYDYWLVNRKQRIEIDRLKDVISQHRNRFIIMKKELLQQKRREEDLLDKINSYKTHSRQVSRISALFDDEYQELGTLHTDAERERELRENNQIEIEDGGDKDKDDDDMATNEEILFDNDALDETKLEQRKRKNSVIIQEKFERIELETEIDDLKVKLEEKDIKIRELEIEVNSWQETHSAIYDSFTSATKLYRQQVEQFNDDEKYYKDKNLELEKHLEILQTQLVW